MPLGLSSPSSAATVVGVDPTNALYGADPSGATDSAAAFRLAMAAARVSGTHVIIPPGTYTFSGLVHDSGATASYVALVAQYPGSVTFQRTTGTRFVDCRGTRGTGVVISADALAGAVQVTLAALPSGGLVAGDIVEMWDSTVLVGHSTTAEYMRVRTVSGTGPYTVVFNGTLEHSYLAANSAELRKMTFLDKVRITGIRFKQTVADRGDLAPAVYITRAKNARIEDCEFRDLDWPAIQIEDGLGDAVERCHFENLIDNAATNRFGYGVNLGQHAEDFRMVNCTSRWVRHLFTTNGDATTGPPRHYYVGNCQAVESSSSGFSPHQEGWFGTFDNCRDHNSRSGGFYLRHPFTTLINPIVTAFGGNNHEPCTRHLYHNQFCLIRA